MFCLCPIFIFPKIFLYPPKPNGAKKEGGGLAASPRLTPLLPPCVLNVT